MKTAFRRTATMLTAVLLLAYFAPGVRVCAMVTDSEADIEFTLNEGPTAPVDPENPGTVDPGPEPVPGSLAIIWVSGFTFASTPVTTAGKLHYTTTQRPNLQVVDLRGSHTGWAVTAKMSLFQEVGDNGERIPLQEGDTAGTLRGVVLHIEDGRLNSESALTHGPTIETGIALAPGGTDQPVLTAAPGKGAGLWIDRWYPETISLPDDNYISLEVPAGAAAVGSHSATITWTIASVPQ